MAPDVVVYFAFVAIFVLAHAGFSVFLGVVGSGGKFCMENRLAYFFPILTVAGNVAIIIAYGVKVVAQNAEGMGTQFAFWLQKSFPLFALSAGTGAAIALLIPSLLQYREHRLYLVIAAAYMLLSAALGMWIILTEAGGISSMWTDILACCALGLCALGFPVIAESEASHSWMMARLCYKLELFTRKPFAPPDYSNLARMHVLVVYSLPANFVVSWSVCQMYVSFKYFLDPARFAADVIFVGFFPVVMSFLLGSESLEYWLHFRIICENARWLVFCAFPVFSDSGFNSFTYPLFFSYSSWSSSGTSSAYVASLIFLSLLALPFVILGYFRPSRAGIPIFFNEDPNAKAKRSAVINPAPAADAPVLKIGSAGGISAKDMKIPLKRRVAKTEYIEYDPEMGGGAAMQMKLRQRRF